jgi:integrase
MRWEELDNLENPTLWTIPGERMKGEDDDPPPPHEVPLTGKMISIIKSLPRFSGPYVFSATSGAKPVNGWSKAKARLDKLSGVAGWKFHDIRRTARTKISAISAEEHVREALLAHGRRGIQAHYDQEKYREPKRHLLEAWEKKLMAIVDPPPPNVTDLDQARAGRAAS